MPPFFRLAPYRSPNSLLIRPIRVSKSASSGFQVYSFHLAVWAPRQTKTAKTDIQKPPKAIAIFWGYRHM